MVGGVAQEFDHITRGELRGEDNHVHHVVGVPKLVGVEELMHKIGYSVVVHTAGHEHVAVAFAVEVAVLVPNRLLRNHFEQLVGLKGHEYHRGEDQDRSHELAPGRARVDIAVAHCGHGDHHKICRLVERQHKASICRGFSRPVRVLFEPFLLGVRPIVGLEHRDIFFAPLSHLVVTVPIQRIIVLSVQEPRTSSVRQVLDEVEHTSAEEDDESKRKGHHKALAEDLVIHVLQQTAQAQQAEDFEHAHELHERNRRTSIHHFDRRFGIKKQRHDRHEIKHHIHR
mmetsp:Transcript_67463/g.186097  ORF Transcript_67463/g.186097 Transcript_67463/m.186097 type:complete len:284 (+) Transcript_67463:3697-4548(+)